MRMRVTERTRRKGKKMIIAIEEMRKYEKKDKMYQ
jgi:hypothetical protein